MTAEVVVVGGGPAGLATALALRQRNVDVVVVDRRVPPVDKACGEGLMPDGVLRLEELGVELRSANAIELQGIRYLDDGVVAEARFCSGPGLGVRRTILHEAMVQRAAEAGVETLWGRPVWALSAAGVETEGGTIRARWIVGADGLHSQVRRWVGLEAPSSSPRRFGARRHFSCEPWSDLVEVYWADGCEAYVTPVGRREVGVALLWGGKKVGFEDLLGRFPSLEARLQGVAASSRDRGAGPFHQQPRAVVRGRVALVGDAAGYRDPITGEGLALAFQQAQVLAVAIKQRNLRLYSRAYHGLTRLPFALIRGLLWAERHPALRRRLIRTLAEEPALFSRLVAIHARQLPPRSLGIGGVVRLVSGLTRRMKHAG
jgi:flavin-dependent dehydrogenase